MNVLPVIIREMRAQARQGFTYSLRVVGAFTLLAAIGALALSDYFLPGNGGRLFAILHRVLLAAIWLLIPLSAADCISRERREGTLGLLFLTPLTAANIVIAKSIAHVLRAFTLWLATLPVQVIPFLLGGVGWLAMMMSCLVNFCSILLVVSVSALASALCRRAQRAVGLTMAMSAGLLAMMTYVVSLFAATAFFLFMSFQNPSSYPGWTDFGDGFLEKFSETAGKVGECFIGFCYVTLGLGNVWSEILGRTPIPVRNGFFIGLAAGVVITVLLALFLMRLAALLVKRNWREPVRSARVEKMEKTFCRPVIGQRWLKRWLKRSLERNPIGWLERRSWSGRLVVWTWLAVAISLYSLALTEPRAFAQSFGGMQTGMAVLLMLSMAATAAGSFRRERENGVLELLLVSPLSEWDVIGGRIRGIWAQFLPTAVLLVFMWFATAGFVRDTNPAATVWVFSSFLALPVIGLYFSLAQTNYLAGFLATLVFGVFIPEAVSRLPSLIGALMFFLSPSGGGTSLLQSPAFEFVALALQSGIAVLLLFRMRRNLARRKFAMERKIA